MDSDQPAGAAMEQAVEALKATTLSAARSSSHVKSIVAPFCLERKPLSRCVIAQSDTLVKRAAEAQETCGVVDENLRCDGLDEVIISAYPQCGNLVAERP